MVANELERCVAEYLAVQYGSANPPPVGNPILIELPSGSIRIYQGEGNVPITLPAVIVSCDTTSQENDCPNVMATLNVIVRMQADQGDDNLEPIGNLSMISRTMFDAMLSSNAVDMINQFRGRYFTCIAFPQQSPHKNARERILEHTLVNTVYCAGKDLL